MKNTILKFGLLSGILCSLLMVATVPFENQIGFERGEVVGYTVIVLSFLLVYFGIRSYRDSVSEGTITFGKACAVGGSITLITCIFYVFTWEVLYFTVLHDFPEKYAAHLVQKARNSGASAAALQAQLEQVQKFKDLYANPLMNIGMTFLEPLPVGLTITLISAAVLRRSKSRSLTVAAPFV